MTPVQQEADDALDMHSVYSENGRRLKSYEKTAKEELTPEGLNFRFDNTFIPVISLLKTPMAACLSLASCNIGETGFAMT